MLCQLDGIPDPWRSGIPIVSNGSAVLVMKAAVEEPVPLDRRQGAVMVMTGVVNRRMGAAVDIVVQGRMGGPRPMASVPVVMATSERRAPRDDRQPT